MKKTKNIYFNKIRSSKPLTTQQLNEKIIMPFLPDISKIITKMLPEQYEDFEPNIVTKIKTEEKN